MSLGLVVVALPIPTGLTAQAWYYFALFVAVIATLVTEPIPGPAAGLIGITVAGILRLVAPTPGESMQWALTGFADSTVWLMFVAFMFALGYQKTGLGRRLALLLVRSLGSRTLGLGYAIALTDLALAPFVFPSTPHAAAGSSSRSSKAFHPSTAPPRVPRHTASARTSCGRPSPQRA